MAEVSPGFRDTPLNCLSYAKEREADASGFLMWVIPNEPGTSGSRRRLGGDCEIETEIAPFFPAETLSEMPFVQLSLV